MNKTIIITGANGNLGTAVVQKFLLEKYRVVAVDQSASQLGFAEGNAGFEHRKVDLGNEAEASTFVSEMISKYKTIEGALLLVGGFAMGDLETTTGEELRKMYALNFETAYFLARPLFRHMLANGYGRIVFIGARPALKPEQGKTTLAYALSKSLLFKLAELLNVAAKGKNVMASVVAPSTLDTALNRKSMPDANPADWVRPGQIADILEFICSETGLPLREAVYKVYNNA